METKERHTEQGETTQYIKNDFVREEVELRTLNADRERWTDIAISGRVRTRRKISVRTKVSK